MTIAPAADPAQRAAKSFVERQFLKLSVLGLDHTGPQDDCMQFGFYVSSNGGEMCDFSPDNVAQILSEPNNEGWFEAMPGETCRGT